MRFWPGAPIDAYTASGFGEQMAMVFPSDDTILVRIGNPEAAQGVTGAIANELAGLLVAALES